MSSALFAQTLRTQRSMMYYVFWCLRDARVQFFNKFCKSATSVVTLRSIIIQFKKNPCWFLITLSSCIHHTSSRKSGPPRRPTYGYFDIAILPIYRGVLTSLDLGSQSRLSFLFVYPVNGLWMRVCVCTTCAHLGWRVNRFRWRCVTLFSSLYIYRGG